MTRLLVETVVYCALAAIVLTLLTLLGLVNPVWTFIVLLLLVPSMIGIFTLAVVIVHDAMSTPEDRSKARLRRHHRNWGL
ncbi:hypothetical protein ADL19_14895 [Streptomyces purpurogeneiscleroticus]|nr:hypothetical protein ADL19_14895 [Streptomyces purpurogeneiscleroticus]